MPDFTPAEEIREAARLMRERAQAVARGPWHWQALGDHGYPQRVVNEGAVLIAECFTSPDATRVVEAEYIASWHPAVAFAVADWLNSFAGRLDDREYDYRDWNAALAVARAYLGTRESADA